jgi:TetR/AcrR family transcriptional regulator
MHRANSKTRQRILRAALRRFAHCGYAGASVQDIVDAARVTKPTLYYYFGSKAGLYQALLDWAYDERFRLMHGAAGRSASLAGQLTGILSVLFEFLQRNRDLMRLAFATAFAAPREMPAEIDYLSKSLRNFEFVHDLIRRAQKQGALDKDFESRELALAIYGLMTIKVMEYLLQPAQKPQRRTAETLVRLFMQGAERKSCRPSQEEQDS